MVVTSTKELSNGANLLLGIQHLFAMFGSTVLVPALTGLNPSVALICAGIGTLIFHFATGHKVPVFVGSSFAFLGGFADDHQNMEFRPHRAALLLPVRFILLLALLVKLIGVKRVSSLFPPVVTGPVIVVIGLLCANRDQHGKNELAGSSICTSYHRSSVYLCQGIL